MKNKPELARHSYKLHRNYTGSWRIPIFARWRCCINHCAASRTGTTAPMAYVQALENGAFAMTLPQLTKAIRTDLMVPDTALANLAAACTQRMTERAEFEARRSAKAQGQLQIQ